MREGFPDTRMIDIIGGDDIVSPIYRFGIEFLVLYETLLAAASVTINIFPSFSAIENQLGRSNSHYGTVSGMESSLHQSIVSIPFSVRLRQITECPELRAWKRGQGARIELIDGFVEKRYEKALFVLVYCRNDLDKVDVLLHIRFDPEWSR